MNRREFLAVSAAGVVGISSLKGEEKEVIHKEFENRLARYKRYERMVADHPSIRPPGDLFETLVEKSHSTALNCGWKHGDKPYHWYYPLLLYGDVFLELVYEPGTNLLDAVQPLSPNTVWKIITIKGKVLEYQQAREGPDYLSAVKYPLKTATEEDLRWSKTVRFKPSEIIHLKYGDDRFYPYGCSFLENPKIDNLESEVEKASLTIFKQEHYVGILLKNRPRRKVELKN